MGAELATTIHHVCPLSPTLFLPPSLLQSKKLSVQWRRLARKHVPSVNFLLRHPHWSFSLSNFPRLPVGYPPHRFNAPGAKPIPAAMPSALALLPPAAAARLLSVVHPKSLSAAAIPVLLRRNFNCAGGPALGRISVRPCDQPVRYMQLFEGQFIAEPFAASTLEGFLLSETPSGSAALCATLVFHICL